MSTEQWILQLLLGGLLGMLGQGIRVVTGLKKVHDQAAAESKSFGQLFELSTLLISLMIGFTAGALAIIATTPDSGAVTKVDRQMIVTLLAAGYAGTDFIEAFVKKYLPADGGAKPVANDADNTPAMG
ncbi:MAG: hypothetical protein HZA59_00380 [Hydrogenophilales bacterium]|nr:hypothetical protein [Hydrogenophilales bacterium]